MTTETIWRWFCSLSEAELHDSGEPILEMRLQSGSAKGFEPVLTEDWDEDEAPQIVLH